MKTNPRHVHGDIRGLEGVRSSQQFEGRFGRMFRTLPPARFDEKAIRCFVVGALSLRELMVDR